MRCKFCVAFLCSRSFGESLGYKTASCRVGGIENVTQDFFPKIHLSLSMPAFMFNKSVLLTPQTPSKYNEGERRIRGAWVRETSRESVKSVAGRRDRDKWMSNKKDPWTWSGDIWQRISQAPPRNWQVLTSATWNPSVWRPFVKGEQGIFLLWQSIRSCLQKVCSCWDQARGEKWKQTYRAKKYVVVIL